MIVLAFTLAIILGVLVIYRKINLEGRSILHLVVILKLGFLKLLEVKITIRPF
jgi:hypothetical protein